MFNLEKSIAEWQQRMLAAGIEPASLEELEGHLRAENQGQVRMVGNEQIAFENAMNLIGHPGTMAAEFKKIEAINWNRPLAWVAWALFVISFFLPAFYDGLGWQCAVISATCLWNSGKVDWGTIHIASLTLANLLMIISPFLLPRWVRGTRSLRWLRILFLAALVLVWSFILRALMGGDAKGLMVGCYLWGFSFLPLCLSTVRIHRNIKIPVQYV